MAVNSILLREIKAVYIIALIAASEDQGANNFKRASRVGKNSRKGSFLVAGATVL